MVAALLVSTLLAGCSGAGTVLTPARGSEAPLGHAGKGTAAFTIKIPHAAKRAAGARGPRYISPATQSLGISITGTNGTPNPTGIPAFVNLTPTSTGCTSSLASTECTAVLPLPAGTYDASLRTYDQTGGAGNLLSQAQNVAFTVVAGAANTISLTLGGIPASVIVTPLAPGYLRGGTGGLRLYGPASQKLIVDALDADGNIIAGAGAPTLSVSASNTASLTVGTASASAPNLFPLTAKTTGTPAIVTPGSQTLTVTATPVSGSGGAPVTVEVPLQILHSAVYVSSSITSTSGAIQIFYDGNTGAANVTASLGYRPAGVAVDAAGTLFIANFSGNSVSEYPAGSTAATATITSGIDGPEGLALDSAGTLYVADRSTPAVTEYSAGSQAVSAALTSGVSEPFGIAVDADGTLYVVENFDNVTKYSAGSTTPTTLIGGLQNPLGVAVDAAGTLYVALNDAGVAKYPAGVSSPSFTLSNGLAEPQYVAVDAADAVYVSDSANGVLAYPAGSVNPTTTIPPTSFSGFARGIAVVPGPLTP